MMTTTEVYDEAALAALISAVTVLGTDLKAGLFTNAIVPSKQLTLAGLNEPTYAGYARQAVVLGPPFRDPINGIAALSAGLTWGMGSVATPTIVVGIFYLTGAGPALLGVEIFKTPIPMNDALDSFVTVLEYIQSQSNPGFTTIVS